MLSIVRTRSSHAKKKIPKPSSRPRFFLTMNQSSIQWSLVLKFLIFCRLLFPLFKLLVFIGWFLTYWHCNLPFGSRQGIRVSNPEQTHLTLHILDICGWWKKCTSNALWFSLDFPLGCHLDILIDTIREKCMAGVISIQCWSSGSESQLNECSELKV